MDTELGRVSFNPPHRSSQSSRYGCTVAASSSAYERRIEKWPSIEYKWTINIFGVHFGHLATMAIAMAEWPN